MQRNYKQTIKHWLAVVFGMKFVYQTESFAQEGEDILIAKLLEPKQTGFYIDIGAHHPFRFSNTYLLYKHGWQGINIDPLPGGMSAFHLNRDRDINLEMAVGARTKTLTYYQFADSALNTFDSTVAQRVIDAGQSELITMSQVQQVPLREITEHWLPAGVEVDLLDVDVEGDELPILQSNDWEKVRPKVICVEYLAQDSIEKILKSDVATYLHDKGYALRARTINTLLFIMNDKHR